MSTNNPKREEVTREAFPIWAADQDITHMSLTLTIDLFLHHPQSSLPWLRPLSL